MRHRPLAQTAKSDFVLPEQAPPIHGRKTLILDLDETLVHSSFRVREPARRAERGRRRSPLTRASAACLRCPVARRARQPVPNADYVIPVNIEGTVHHVYVIKRPCVDEFMERVGRLFEVIVYTASLAKYADPLLDQLDVHNVVHGRLFREHCTQYQGNFVKDLTRLGRPLSQTIIIDNSPASYMFQPENAIGCTSFIDNMHDRELLYIADFLETLVDVEVRRSATRARRTSLTRRLVLAGCHQVHAFVERRRDRQRRGPAAVRRPLAGGGG